MTIHEELRRIDGLTWIPWIGINYTSWPCPIMILGESHYSHGSWSPKRIDRCPRYTSEIVGDYVKMGRDAGEQWKMYEPVEIILRNTCFSARDLRIV